MGDEAAMQHAYRSLRGCSPLLKRETSEAHVLHSNPKPPSNLVPQAVLANGLQDFISTFS